MDLLVVQGAQSCLQFIKCHAPQLLCKRGMLRGRHGLIEVMQEIARGKARVAAGQIIHVAGVRVHAGHVRLHSGQDGATMPPAALLPHWPCDFCSAREILQR